MKTIQRLSVLTFFTLFFASQTMAQGLKMPQPSSTQTLTQDFGLGKISLVYSRPNLRGRTVFGGLVPYGQVWRTGANGATLLTLSEEVKINGTTVPAGEYGLFTIPGKSEWTVIISKGSKQWGSYAYKEADDLIRFKVKPTTLKDKVETFTIQFDKVYENSAVLNLMWENTAVAINLGTETDSRVMASIEESMMGEKKPYLQAAQYYYANGKDMTKALEWANAAEAADSKAPWVRYWKARIQLKAGDKKGAAATAEAGIKAAKDMNMDEYVRLNSAVLAEAKK
ncbi:MAG TPA: DUF2911 domain-containing protein [Pedobacter sp.]|jgi:hypothetical protein